MSTPNKVLDRFRQSEYTGKNRCPPCTMVNCIIAVVLAAVIAILWLPAGITALVLFAATIYFRGYLVPGTPELTQRYFPPWLLRAFGKKKMEDIAAEEGATEALTTDDDQPAPAETEQLLRSAGVVENCPHEDDLCLTSDFRRVWWRRIRRFRSDDERAASQLAAVIDVDPATLDFAEQGDNFAAIYEGKLIGQWTSDAAFYADLATEPTLAEWLPEWDELDDQTRTELLAGMRAFLTECPACEAELDQVENVRKSCCASELVSVSVDCSDCGALVFSGSYV